MLDTENKNKILSNNNKENDNEYINIALAYELVNKNGDEEKKPIKSEKDR